MAQTVTEMKAEIKQLLFDIDISLSNIVVDIQGLKDKVSQGGTAIPQDFDEILTSLRTLGTAAKAIDDSTPPADPVP